jgi:hypothetical protein
VCDTVFVIRGCEGWEIWGRMTVLCADKFLSRRKFSNEDIREFCDVRFGRPSIAMCIEVKKICQCIRDNRRFIIDEIASEM